MRFKTGPAIQAGENKNETKKITKKLQKQINNEKHPEPKISTENIYRKYATVNEIKTKMNPACGSKFFVEITILGKKTICLTDTGSQINLIGQNQVDEEILRNLAPARFGVKSYTGDCLQILGTFETDIVIGEIKLEKILFYVVTDSQQAIIGTPILSQQGLSIDLHRRSLNKNGKVAQLWTEPNREIKTNSINLKLTSKIDRSNKIQFESTIDVIIPANSEKFIKIEARHPIEYNGYYATEISSINTKFGVLIGKSVSSLSHNKTSCVICVCNATNRKITIEKNTRLINMVEVSIQEQVQTIPNNSAEKIARVLQEVKIGTNNPEMKRKAQALVEQYADIFAADDELLGHTDQAIYHINTGNSPPIAQQRYRTPYYLKNELKQIIDKNVESGLMEPCSSPWSAPVLLVKKPNGSWRLVCDYRKLNNVTVADCYPLPQIDDLITSLSHSKVYSSSDLWTGFHQIPCTEETKQKLAIATEFGQFTWTAMPMGGKNCPAAFQRLMDKTFHRIPRSRLVIYIDDFMAHDKTEEANINNCQEVFALFRKNKLKLRASKTKLLMSEIEFCGYTISDGVKKPNQNKVVAVKQLKNPSNKQEAQSLFGLLNYHRSFIPYFARKSAPITDTYKGNFSWTTAADTALSQLKTEICTAALQLRIPDVNNANYVLETDASNEGYGACLFICNKKKDEHHHNANCLRPVEYLSKRFDTAQRNYQTMEKELLAGKEALKKWSHFLLGRKFIWRTDNSCLAWAQRIRSRKLKISQWMAEIAEYNFTIQLRPSATMKVTDCLSRQYVELNMLQVRKPQLAELQDNDEILHEVKNFVTINRWPIKPSEQIRPYARKREHLIFGRAGELLLNENNRIRTIPPKSLKHDIIKSYHDSNGHPGENQCINQLQRNYYWPGLTIDVKNYINTCHQCQVTKPCLRPHNPPQGKSQTPKDSWEVIAWDLIGPLNITRHGNRYGLIGIDTFSKKVYGQAIPAKDSVSVTRHIKQMLLRNPKMPKVLLSDNGGEFVGLQQLCQLYGITNRKSAPYHPQTNGAVERANQTIKNRLFSTLNGEDSWDDRLDEVLHSINCSSNAVTGVSPFQIETGHAGTSVKDKMQHSTNPRANIESIVYNVHSRIVNEKEQRQEKFGNENFQPYVNGSLVLAKNMVNKLPRFLGPFKIIEIRGHGASYKLRDISTGITLLRSGIHLKPYNLRENPIVTEREDEQTQSESDESDEIEWEDPMDDFYFPVRDPENSDSETDESTDCFSPTASTNRNSENNSDLNPDPSQDPNENRNENLNPDQAPDPNPDLNENRDQNLNPDRNPDQNPDLNPDLNADLNENRNQNLNHFEAENTEWVDGANISIYHLAETDGQEGQINDETLDHSEPQLEVRNETIQSTTQPCSDMIQNNTESAEEPESDIQLSDSSLIDPSTSPCHLTTNEMNMEQIDQLIEKYEVDGMKYIEGLKYDKMAAINEHFNKYHPDWPKTSNNVLVFQTNFEISREKTLGQLSKGHLLTLMSHYGIRKPRFLNTMKKSNLQSYLDSKIRKHFPTHPVHQESNELIFQPTYSTK